MDNPILEVGDTVMVNRIATYLSSNVIGKVVFVNNITFVVQGKSFRESFLIADAKSGQIFLKVLEKADANRMKL